MNHTDRPTRAQIMARWIKDFGYEATINQRGNVCVSLKNRSVTVGEIERECYLRREFLRRAGDGTVTVMIDRGPVVVVVD